MSPREPDSRALYPRLNGGRGGPGAEAVASHQRGRLMGAMVEAVWRHGYAGTTVAELVALAGVSKSTFYAHFESKEECFLATFDAGAAALKEQMDAAHRSNGASPTGRLEIAVRILARGAVEQPKAAKLMTIESFAPGAAAVPHRNRFLGFLEEAAMEALEASDSARAGSPPDPLARAIAGGLCHATYACIRDGRPERLEAESESLLAWALAYRDAGPPPRTPGRAASSPAAEPEKDPARRSTIARAALEIAAEDGYAALTIPRISARAAISNQTFYEHFESKREAFLTGFDALAAEVRATVHRAFEDGSDWPEGFAAATSALLERIASDPLLASVAMFELPTLGAGVLESRGLIRNGLGVLIERQIERSKPSGLSPLVLEAIQGGIATTVQLELAAGRSATLPKLAPALAQLAVVPVLDGGAAAAAGR